MRIHFKPMNIICYRSCHVMKSSRSSSQLTDGGAAGGVVWLDEPLAFPFLSFLDLRSCTGGGTSCVGGHSLGA